MDGDVATRHICAMSSHHPRGPGSHSESAAPRDATAADKETMEQRRCDSDTERRLGAHIFSVSAGLVGVCLTVIGLFRVVVTSKNVDSIADNMLAFDALTFLIACLFSYLSLRSTAARARNYERVADISFLGGLALMVAIGGLIAYEIV
jgi:hypothetical protein